MKKLVFAIIIFSMALPAFACKGGGHGMYGRWESHHNRHMGGDWGNCREKTDYKSVNAKEAEAAVDKYIKDEKLKGYTVKTAVSHSSGNKGVFFTIEAQDAGGNPFIFYVSPCGIVDGPFIKNEIR